MGVPDWGGLGLKQSDAVGWLLGSGKQGNWTGAHVDCCCEALPENCLSAWNQCSPPVGPSLLLPLEPEDQMMCVRCRCMSAVA